MTATLVSEVEAVCPGSRFSVGIRLEMEPEWHTYWRNPGDSGLATQVAWRLPDGFTSGPIEWPRPERIPVGPLMNYGYHGDALLLVAITPPSHLTTGSVVTIGAHLRWLECREACIPGKTDLAIRLPVRAGKAEAVRNPSGLFAAARRRLPVAARGWRASTEMAGKHLLVDWVPPRGTRIPTSAYFFPYRPDLIDHAAPQVLVPTARGFRLEIAKAANPPESPLDLSGVLLIETDDRSQAFLIEDPASGTLSLTRPGDRRPPAKNQE